MSQPTSTDGHSQEGASPTDLDGQSDAGASSPAAADQSAATTAAIASDGGDGRGRRRKRATAIATAAFAVELAGLLRRGYGLGGNVAVRCQAGHVFTTIWLPGISLKSLRLGWWRFQYCPVGKHWSLVRLVAQSDLTNKERRTATKRRDIRIP